MDQLSDWLEGYDFNVVIDPKSIINVSVAVVITTMAILILLKYFKK